MYFSRVFQGVITAIEFIVFIYFVHARKIICIISYTARDTSFKKHIVNFDGGISMSIVINMGNTGE